MKRFSKEEILGLVIIFMFVFVVMFLNLRVSIRRARDSQRQSDVNAISDGLTKYQQEFGFFPPNSKDGKIIACRGENYEEVKKILEKNNRFDQSIYETGLKECEWGEDSLGDLEGNTFVEKLPKDPYADRGFSYLYVSNFKRFQIFAHLEGGSDENVYRPEIAQRSLSCGINYCNFGKAYSDTPLDKTPQEYENELLMIKGK